MRGRGPSSWNAAAASIVMAWAITLSTQPGCGREARPAAVADAASRRVTRSGEVVGFAMTEDDEVDQVYVAPSGRGSGAATALLGEAERRIRDAGHASAWLAVVGGNARARAFYERQGWIDEGPFTHDAPGPEGPIPVTAHRYVKALS